MLTTLALSIALADPVHITLADRELEIPAPTGYTDARGVVDSGRFAWDETGDLAALFLPAEDVDALAAGATVTRGGFFAIQVLAGTAGRTYSREDFDRLRADFRAEWEENLDRAGVEDGGAAHLIRHSMLMLMHADVDEQVTETTPLPVMLDHEHAISTGEVIVQRGPGDRPGQLAVDVSSVSLVFVRDRVFVATAEAPYHEHADAEVLAQRLADWVDDIVASNPPGWQDRLEALPHWVPWLGLAFLLLLATVVYRRFW